jgi:hypothetical protein
VWAEFSPLLCFVKSTGNGDGAYKKVPEDVALAVSRTAYRDFPVMPEVVYTPLFVKDGRAITKPGFYGKPHDPELNLLMADTGFQVQPVSEEPDAAEMEESLQWIREELLSDFPFLDYDSENKERREPSEANALAMIITPFMRRMINGLTPLFFVTKPEPGTGGTLLGKIPIILFDGVESPPVRYSQNEEEMNKGLIAAIMETRSHLFFDDVKEFNNRELLRAITSMHLGGRVLGGSKTTQRPNTLGWISTGNNPIIGSEMERRIVWIKLNPKSADIQTRTFKHTAFEEFLFENRAVAVHHILTLIKYWITTGMVPFELRKRASFEDWSAKVGGVLQACGIEGFLDNRREAAQDMDEAAIKSFVREWLLKYGLNVAVLPSNAFKWAFDSEMDIVEGNNDDQKKNRFVKRMASLDGRTFKIDEIDYMMRSGFDQEKNAAFYLAKVEP